MNIIETFKLIKGFFVSKVPKYDEKPNLTGWELVKGDIKTWIN